MQAMEIFRACVDKLIRIHQVELPTKIQRSVTSDALARQSES
jgi:hypothetical protein